MRKLKLFFACLLMAVLSIGQVWADTETYTFASKTWTATNSADEDANWVNVSQGSGFAAGQGIQLYANNTTSGTSPDSFDDIEEIVVHYCCNNKKGYGTVSVQVGDGEAQEFSIAKPSSSGGGTALKTEKLTFSPKESGTVTISMSSSENSIYLHSVDITYTPAAPADPYTVTLMDDTENPLTEESAGAGVTLPSRDGCTGYTFSGWTKDWTAAQTEWTTTAPTIIPAGNYAPTADENLYPVYTKTEEGGGESGSVEITLNTSNFPTSYGTANTFTEYTLEGYKFKIQQIYVTGSGDNKKHQWRASGNSNGTGTIYNTQVYPAKISSIVLTYHSSDANKNHTLTVGSTENPTDGTSITGTTVGSVETFDCSTANADYFVLANGANVGYTTSIKINYGSAGTTYYLSNPTCTPPAVADPVISLAAGEYEGAQSGVTITCATAGAEIYYTTDDSDPTSSSIHYTGAISINASQTIKAIAIKEATESNIVSAEYTIITTCETPTFSLAEGSYEGTQSVELSCTRAGVTIYYTTDGSDPAESATKIEYASAISISESKTIKAVATKANLTNSAIASATYTITAGPDVTLDFLDGKWSFPTSYQTTEEEFTNSVTSYAVTCKGTGSNGYKIMTDYLIIGKQNAYIVMPEFSNPVEKIVFVKGNGDNPSGNVLFNIFDGDDAVSTQVKGCDANKEFIIVNPAANKQYTLKVTSDHNLQIGGLKIYFGEAPAVAQPTITGNAAFVGSQDVTITCATTGAAIYYTTDATKKDDPSTTEWSTYGTKVTLNASCTLYAAATTDGGTTWSAVASKAFTATPLYTSIEALQGVATSDEATVFVQMTNWVVTATTNIYAYVTDGSGKGMIFFKNGHDFAIGDKLNKAQLQTTLQNYNGTYELKNLTTADFAGEGELVHNAEITPIAKTATEYAALTNANQGALFVVNSLTFDETNHKFVDDNANEIAYYNKFSIEEGDLVDGHKYNVTGVAVYYKPNEGDPVVQLCPRTAADLVDNTAYVQISFDANTTADVTGTLPTTVTNHISGTDYTVPAASLARTDGYYQLGWNTDATATTALTSLENVTTDQILYAIWKETANCTISFYSKGQLYDTKVKAQNAEYDFNDVVAPTVQGWTFYGWSADEIATEEASATKLTSVTPTSETMTLYAIFSRKVDGTPYTQYEKVTAEPSNWSGEYLLVYESGSEAFNSAIQTFDVAYNGIDVTINEGVIASNATVDAAAITIAPMTGGYSILGANGKYVGATSYANAIATSDDPIANSLSLSGEDAVIGVATSGGTVTMRYNSATDQLRFRYYKSGQKAIQLYRKNTIVPQVDVYTTAPVVRFNITFTLASGEEGTFNPISVVQGDDQELPVAVPTKANHTFNKWTDGVNLYAAGATIENVQADIELSATWTENSKANVTFDVNGASGSVAAIENVYEGTDYTLPAAPTYDDDHAFAGWKLGDDVFAAGTVRQMSTPAAPIEYEAQWNTIVEDQVVIVVEYDETTYALSNNAGDKRLNGIAVEYKYGNFYGVAESDKAAIIWTRRTVGNNVTFRIGEQYLTGKSNGTDLTLGASPCVWTLTEGNYLIGERTFLYQAGTVNAFRGYKTSEAGTGAYSSMPEMAQPKFNTTYTRPDAVQGQLGTICVPNGGRMEGATPFEIAYMDYDADHNPYKIYLDEVEELVAGRPYFFLSEDENPDVKVYYTDEENIATAGNYRGLYGTFNQIDQLEKGYYIVYNNLYYHVTTNNVRILANRAYIKLSEVPGNVPAQDPDPTKAPRRIALGNGNAPQVTTGCENIQAGEAPVKMMIDGQLFILRGEKMYDVTGKLVK